MAAGAVLNDVDDDEAVREAPALLVGEPPWVVEETEQAEHDDVSPVPSAPRPLQPVPLPDPPPAAVVPAAPPPPPRPTPRALDRHRPGPPPGPSRFPLRRPRRSLTAASADEREQLRHLLDQAERRANRSENELKSAKSRLRKVSSKKSTEATAVGPQFADREQGFRYLVLTQWATRTLPGEQRGRPLPEVHLGQQFLDSFDRLEGSGEKVADVVFEIVAGLAPENPSRGAPASLRPRW